MNRDARVGRFAAGSSPSLDSRSTLSLAELAQVVHDFKSPLSVVTLEMQVLLDKLSDGAHGDLLEPITRVSLNLEYLDRLMQNLIDSCAIDAGRFALHRNVTNLSGLLRSVAQRMSTSRERGRLIVDAPPAVMLDLDSLKIERVIANLVHNAIKYSPPTARVVARLQLSDGVVRASVADAGPGIPQDQTEEVFEQYRRAPSAHLHEGTGLGLYVSKRIVEAHGGRIGVESVVGVGSEFFFELPLH